MRITATTCTSNHKLSRLLLAILLAAASNFLHEGHIPVACWAAEVANDEVADVPTTTATAISSVLPSSSSEISSCNESSSRTTVRPCPDPVLLKISYVSRGSVDCGGALTPAQANMAPQVKVANPTIVDPEGLYALVLVDTTTTTDSDGLSSFRGKNTDFDSIRPILHYGAVNIPGSSLLQGLSLDRSDHIDVFFSYRGPASPSRVTDPRAIVPTEESNNGLLVYEFLLGVQPDGDEPMEVPTGLIGSSSSPMRFDYEAFFDETMGLGFENLTATTHFRSGSCVRDPILTIREEDKPALGEEEEEDVSLSSLVGENVVPTLPSNATAAVKVRPNATTIVGDDEPETSAPLSTSSSGASRRTDAMNTTSTTILAAIGLLFMTLSSSPFC